MEAVRKLASWSNFSCFAINKISKYAQGNQAPEKNDLQESGLFGEQFVSSLKRKPRTYFKKDSNSKFKAIYSTHKLGFYRNMKDLTPVK